jgi:hypothetical protein
VGNSRLAKARAENNGQAEQGIPAVSSPPEDLAGSQDRDADFPFGANEGAGPSAAPAEAGPFSREALRLSQDYSSALGLEKHVHSIPVDKPTPESWFRVRDDNDFVFDTYLLHIKNGPDRGVYQVAAPLLPLLSGEKLLKPTRLVLCIDRQGELRLWPLRLPGPDGREDDWMASALAVCEQAKSRWVRLVAEGNGFTSRTTSADLPEPVWPEKSFDALLDLAFAKRRIASESDPVLRRLREGA